MKFLSLFFTLVSLNSFALNWESGTEKIHLVELYTSESCSSCPPAEAWLNNLKDDDLLYKEVVPVEYHVDYWNYLSWEDKHSDNKFTRRQRLFAQKRGTSVFTPQILQNGKKDLRYSAHYPKKANKKVPNLKVSVNQKTGEVLLTTKNSPNLVCEAVLTQGGYVSKIRSGENSGKTLKHEFVVEEMKTKRLKNNECRFKFDNLENKKGRGIALWLRSPDTFEVIQATGKALN